MDERLKKLRRCILVGELNPYGSAPEYALYPYPEHASGGRLASILGLTADQYLELFVRHNLCTGRWDGRAAKLAAARITAGVIAASDEKTCDLIILLGAKVAGAFFRERNSWAFFLRYDVIATNRRFVALVLPHPSGRNLMWNDPANVERARHALRDEITSVRTRVPK